jgi:hypothetical protein
MNRKIIVIKPMKYTNLDGSNPRYVNWGKFGEIRYDWAGGEKMINPIFESLWPGLLLKKRGYRNLYWYEWIEYFSKRLWRKVETFFYYQKKSIIQK